MKKCSAFALKPKLKLNYFKKKDIALTLAIPNITCYRSISISEKQKFKYLIISGLGF